MLPKPAGYYVEKLRAVHEQMQENMLQHLRAQEEDLGSEDLAGVADVRGGDTIYTIDAHVDEVLHAFCETWAREDGPFVLISEGIEDAGWRVFPESATETDAQFLMIVDPIDGTRNIMYNKRAAWILSGIAPNKGRETTLADIEAAVMTEAPTTRALYADQLWATVGGGAHRESRNLFTGARKTLPLRPSQADNLAHGFASIAKFFPPAKAATAAFEEKLLALVAPDDGENPLVFDDQYIATGGQIYEILVGHDRFLADLRPVFFEALGLPKKLVCHPYDICTELIAREAGVLITDENGQRLSAPLDIRANVAWAGYANAALRDRIEPHLQALLKEVTNGHRS
ncbi:MAG: inositol monophosphatase [Cytophagales bacterium]|nr:inositol monophosphatase [Armatimonadota bacterium]